METTQNLMSLDRLPDLPLSPPAHPLGEDECPACADALGLCDACYDRLHDPDPTGGDGEDE